MSCNFMAAAPGNVIARDHYSKVAARVRQGPPFKWLDLASVPLTETVNAAAERFVMLATHEVMPLPWNETPLLAVRRLDTEHDRHLASDVWCYMLANKTIKTQQTTRHFPAMPRDELLADDSFLGFLLREAIERLPGSAPAAALPASP
jgi:hypothetical protein